MLTEAMLRLHDAGHEAPKGEPGLELAPPLSHGPLSTNAMKKAGVLLGSAVVSFSPLSGGGWAHAVQAIPSASVWSHIAPITAVTELWVASGSATVQSSEGTTTFGRRTRAFLTGLERVFVSAHSIQADSSSVASSFAPIGPVRRACSLPSLSPVPEDETEAILEDALRSEWSVHDGSFFASSFWAGKGRVPNERAMLGMYSTDHPQ
tara:strand:- start:5074 stop:5694 length:621 start_codon:yes stop_codon:yes gene_type:complete